MARSLRIDVAGAWYHVMNRGHRGGTVFVEDEDRRRFLGAVSELPGRYGLEVHAFMLMDNHYQLLVRTREANLSHAIRWLNVSYAVKFNWAHRWVPSSKKPGLQQGKEMRQPAVSDRGGRLAPRRRDAGFLSKA